VDYKLTIIARSLNGDIRSIEFEKDLLFDLYETERLYTCTISSLSAQYSPTDNRSVDLSWQVFDGFTNKLIDPNDLKYFQFNLKYCTLVATENICQNDILILNQTKYRISKEKLLDGKLYTIHLSLLKLNDSQIQYIDEASALIYSKPVGLTFIDYRLNGTNLTIYWNQTNDTMINYFMKIAIYKPIMKDNVFAVPIINRQPYFIIENIMQGKAYEIGLSHLIVDTFNNRTVESDQFVFNFTTSTQFRKRENVNFHKNIQKYQRVDQNSYRAWT
jgi:hypothetical protein